MAPKRTAPGVALEQKPAFPGSNAEQATVLDMPLALITLAPLRGMPYAEQVGPVSRYLSCRFDGGTMMAITDTARQFFDACETGKGWTVCQAWCHDGATFACQSDALATRRPFRATPSG